MLEKIQSKYAEVLLSCVEEKYFKTEAVWAHHSLMKILSGEMKIVLADDCHTFSAGDSLLVPRNQLSTVIKRPKDGRPYKSILVTLKPERLNEYYAKTKLKFTQPSTQKVRAFSKHPLLEGFFASLLPYFELESELPKEIIPIKIKEAITILRSIDKNADSLLADFSEPGKINLAEFMEKNFMFNMQLEKFALLTGRSLATFNRDFRIAFHATPQKWLTQKRLDLAHYQLAEKRRRPVDVYLQTGFENLSHFSRVFKQHFGYTPTDLVGRGVEIQ